MDKATSRAEVLRSQIATTEEELRSLSEQLAAVEAKEAKEAKEAEDLNLLSLQEKSGLVTQGKWPLELEEYKRYGRQMIVPNVGIQGDSLSSVFILILLMKFQASSD
jgi:adenylyltransferase and sulfurtransferase